MRGFGKKVFFHTFLGFTRLENNPGKTYLNKKPIETSETEKIIWKCDCIGGKILIDEREPFFCSHSFDNSLGHKKTRDEKIKTPSEKN